MSEAAHTPLSAEVLDEAERRALVATVAEAWPTRVPTCHMRRSAPRCSPTLRLLSAG